MRIRKVIFTAAIISMVMSGTAFAGTWKTGAEPDQNRWWYDFDNGSYASNGWYWIDGDNNGIAECYYFDAAGWLLANTTTPDGYTVNESGAWVQNGVIQTKGTTASQNKEQVQATASDFDLSWITNEDGTVNWELEISDGEDWCGKNDVEYSLAPPADLNAYYTETIVSWAQNSSRGALWKQLLDRYHMPYYLGNYITAESNDIGKFDYTMTLPAGIPESEMEYVAFAVDFVLNIGARYDGCLDGLSWKWTIGEDGRITVRFTGNVLLYASRW